MFRVASHTKDERLLTVFLHRELFRINYSCPCASLKSLCSKEISLASPAASKMPEVAEGQEVGGIAHRTVPQHQRPQHSRARTGSGAGGGAEALADRRPSRFHTRGPFRAPAQSGGCWESLGKEEAAGPRVWGEPCFCSQADPAAAPSL